MGSYSLIARMSTTDSDAYARDIENASLQCALSTPSSSLEEGESSSSLACSSAADSSHEEEVGPSHSLPKDAYDFPSHHVNYEPPPIPSNPFY